MHAPEPERVLGGREAKIEGTRLAEPGAARLFFCRTCGVERVQQTIPRGWYRILRSTGKAQPVRLGIYCSVACLAAQMSRLAGIEADTGDQFDDPTRDRG